MKWGSGEVITSVASDYVSIEWNGFLKADETGSYVFEVKSNDGFRLYINEELILERWTQVTDELSGH